jgi:hypothetical protein
VSARANTLLEQPDTEIGGGSLVAGIRQSIDQAADVRLDPVPSRVEQCDGISIGLRFRATPVSASAMPALEPACAEQIASEADAGAGD